MYLMCAYSKRGKKQPSNFRACLCETIIIQCEFQLLNEQYIPACKLDDAIFSQCQKINNNAGCTAYNMMTRKVKTKQRLLVA